MSTIAFVSGAGSGDVSVLRLDATSSALTPVQRVELGGNVMPLALSPDRRRLYAARRSEPLAVASFAIDAASGELAQLGEAPLPHSMAYIATDRSGRHLLSASYGGHLVAVNAIGADGVVRETTQVVPTGANAHAICTDPSNRFAFATNLGAGVVQQFRFDAGSGHLAPNDPPQVEMRAGAGPRHLAWHPQGRFVALLNELDGSIDILAFDAGRGTLSQHHTVSGLPPGFAGKAWAADLHFTPDGRFLYSSDRGSNTLAAFAFDAAGGRLTRLGHTPAPAEPRGFNISPDGRFLLAAGQAADVVAVYRIDPPGGTLALVGEHAMGHGPNWIEMVRLS